MKKYFKFILISQLIILICYIFALNKQTSLTNLNVSLSDWQSDYIQHDEIWKVEENQLNTNDPIPIIYGPYMALKKGSYTLKLNYQTDSVQTFWPRSATTDNILINQTALQPFKNEIVYNFDVLNDISDFEVLVSYNNIGNLEINNITLYQNNFIFYKILVYIIAFFILIDLIIIFYKQIKQNWYIYLILISIIGVISLPLIKKGLFPGHDIYFHLARIEGLYNELKNGVFPVRMASYWNNGYGYPSSIYYGDFLLYFPAMLRLFKFSIIEAYKLHILLINILIVIVSYICFNKIFNNKNIALVVTFVYSIAEFSILTTYIRAAIGEYSCKVFIPILCLAIYTIYTTINSATLRKASTLLAFAMTCIINTHILTTQMIVFILIIFCILTLKSTLNINTIKTYIIAVFKTILMSLFFVVPLIDYYLNVKVKINQTIESEKYIQQIGVMLKDYLSVKTGPFDFEEWYIKNPTLTPGIILIFTLFAGFIFLFIAKNKKSIILLTVMSSITLILSSNIFPWDYIGTNTFVGNILVQVQFPWRYLSLAIPLLSLLLGFILTELNYLNKTKLFLSINIMIITVSAVLMGFFIKEYFHEERFIYPYDEPSIYSPFVSAGEYLRDITDVNTLYSLKRQPVSNNSKLTVIKEKGTNMDISCQNNSQPDTIIFPYFNYKGYVINDDNNNYFEIIDGENGLININIPANYDGNISLRFKSPWYWRLSEIISLIFITYCLCTWKNKKQEGLINE